MTTICEYCENSITKNNLTKHQKSETCNKIKQLLNKQKNKYELQINLLEDINKKNINIIQELTQENNTLKTEIKALEKASEGYRKIVEKAATKSTNTINKNYQHNNYLNYISSEPINFKNLKNQLKDIVTTQSVMYDDEDFHNHIVDNIFKDKNGKDKLLCTDINRKNFTYKDEKSGELISDPELERLREQLKKGTDIKLIRRNLLEKLVNEYEENGSIGIDPYKQFSDIIQKLNFGTPFVDHMAKKTYVKTKSNTDDPESDYKDIEERDNNENKEDTEDTEKELSTEEFKEYKQLYEEFKNDV
jgi:hypothetical protein